MTPETEIPVESDRRPERRKRTTGKDRYRDSNMKIWDINPCWKREKKKKSEMLSASLNIPPAM